MYPTDCCRQADGVNQHFRGSKNNWECRIFFHLSTTKSLSCFVSWGAFVSHMWASAATMIDPPGLICLIQSRKSPPLHLQNHQPKSHHPKIHKITTPKSTKTPYHNLQNHTILKFYKITALKSTNSLLRNLPNHHPKSKKFATPKYTKPKPKI